MLTAISARMRLRHNESLSSVSAGGGQDQDAVMRDSALLSNQV